MAKRATGTKGTKGKGKVRGKMEEKEEKVVEVPPLEFRTTRALFSTRAVTLMPPEALHALTLAEERGAVLDLANVEIARLLTPSLCLAVGEGEKRVDVFEALRVRR